MNLVESADGACRAWGPPPGPALMVSRCRRSRAGHGERAAHDVLVRQPSPVSGLGARASRARRALRRQASHAGRLARGPRPTPAVTASHEIHDDRDQIAANGLGGSDAVRILEEGHERVADEIAVMYAGQIVQISKAAALNGPLRHPYTELLASSIPTLRTDWLDQLASERLARDNLADDAGDRPIPDRLRGCSFYGRCQLGQAGICDLAVPPLEHAANGSLIRCVLNEQIFLRPQSIPQPSQKECRHG